MKFNWELNEEIGKRIQQLRLERNLTRKIANDIGTQYDVPLDPQFLMRIERGTSEIPLNILIAIAGYFKVLPGWFINPDNEGKNSPQAEDLGSLTGNPNLYNAIFLLSENHGNEFVQEYFEQIHKSIALMNNEKSAIDKYESMNNLELIQQKSARNLRALNKKPINEMRNKHA